MGPTLTTAKRSESPASDGRPLIRRCSRSSAAIVRFGSATAMPTHPASGSRRPTNRDAPKLRTRAQAEEGAMADNDDEAVEVPGGALHVTRFGSGPREVLAIHGITASSMSMAVVARHLGDEHTLWALDLRGRGAS